MSKHLVDVGRLPEFEGDTDHTDRLGTVDSLEGLTSESVHTKFGIRQSVTESARTMVTWFFTRRPFHAIVTI